MDSASDIAATPETRIGFVVDLARRLHEYGTAAPRLEDVVNRIGRRLGLVCNVLSTPTAIVMSFGDRDESFAETARVVRLPPGEVNLGKLCATDAIANRVITGAIGLADGRRELRAVGREAPPRWMTGLGVAAFGVSSAAIAVVLHCSAEGVVASGLIGILIGLLAWAARFSVNLAAAADAVAALLATAIAIVVAARITPIDARIVIVASLIVLLPGMTLTTAARELSSQHLISGTARLMGAITTLLKLAFGAVVASQVAIAIGLGTRGIPGPPLTDAWVWPAIVVAAISFAVLFQARFRDYPLVVGAVLLGYLCTRAGAAVGEPAFGTFLGGFAISAASNLYARITDRPGALIREPGIVLLVPGSVGFRTLNYVFEHNVTLGLDTAVALITLLVAIVAGLLFGDLLVPPRHRL